MTAKRFIIKNERTVCDGFYGKCFVCSWKSDAEEVCNLLNKLHEENQKLKEENAELEKFRYLIFKRMGELYEEQ